MNALCLLLLLQAQQGTGVKVGEVTHDSAIVWVRLTAKKDREANGACPGAPGKVRVRYGTKSDLSGAKATPWAAVTEATDYAHQFPLAGLTPSTVYYFATEAEGGSTLKGRFETAPDARTSEPVTFTVITGQANRHMDHPDGFNIYPAMAALKPKFLVNTGDIVYYDNDPPNANSPQTAYFHWQRMFSFPRHIDFHLQVPGFWEKDDHDTVDNDCWPGAKMGTLTFKEGQRIFLEMVPMGPSTYRTHRWGKDLQIWLPEGRDFRSPNNAPDGPKKTIWGAEQKAWLKQTIQASDATWKVLISPTPIVGPDKGGKSDNHVNDGFKTEGDEIRQWVQKNGGGRLFLVCGDRHWQYHSVDPVLKIQEFSCGPVSDAHAGDAAGENKTYHKFYRKNGGFLSVSVAGKKISFRFHDVGGKVVYEQSYP